LVFGCVAGTELRWISRGLQGTVKLALHLLSSHPHEAEGRQLLAFLAFCPSVKTPWSLFDGGGVSGPYGARPSRCREGHTVGHVLCLHLQAAGWQSFDRERK
jgi:hypothetical protein